MLRYRDKIFPFFLFVLFGALLLSDMAQGQGRISVESRVDRSKILIGDVIRYSVIITHDEDVKIQSPSLAANLGSFEIRDYKVLEPRQEDNQIIEQTDYMISTFEIGEFEIPPIEIGYTVGSDTTLQTIKSEPITITVESLNPDEAGDIRDIKFPLEPPRDYKKIILSALLALFGILFILGIIYYLKRRREGKSLIPRREKPPRPAHEEALEALEKLVQSDMLEKGQVKQYYSELSEIIRQYIERRFFIIALEMTSSQLIDAMHQEEIDPEYIEMMREFLDVCDLVKFAKYIPTDEENKKTTQIAFDFVDRTKLVIVEEAEEAEPAQVADNSVEQETVKEATPEEEAL